MRFGVLLGLCLSLASAAYAQPASRAAVHKPTTAIDQKSCVTADCHATVKAAPVIHGPVDANSCDSCHQAKDVAQHTFEVSRKGAELCTFCHEFSTEQMPTVHKPVTQGECLGCHDPHGGQTRNMTREKTTAELCSRCHENVMAGKSFIHSPVTQGECDSCHTPHASRFPKMLDLAGSDLCLACHKEFEPAISSAKFKHKAMEKGCSECHSAHGSNAPMSLVKAVPDLCSTCHEHMQQNIASAKVKHSANTMDRACLNCHTSHASNVGKLLAELPATGCLKCHDKSIKQDDGTVVAAVAEVADPKLVKHGEIKDGQCSGCHQTHGSANEMLLIKAYTPTAFYQDFTEENYALCLSCHDSKLAEAQKTDKATGFRNGTENLHYIHAAGRKDRNCRACHVTHAGPNAKLVRTSIRFGKWNMKVGFTKTDTGGTCTTGCHGPYAYDRERAIPTTRPTAIASTPKLAPAAPRSAHEDSRLVSWSAIDAAGTAVSIPDKAGRPTVLLMLSAEDATSAEVVKQLRTAAPQHKPANYIVIIGGPGSTPSAKKLLEAQKSQPWPVIADETHGDSQALGVNGWPMVLVLRPDGLEVARLTGDPQFLAMKLDAYLEVAAGRLDPAKVSERIATKPVAEAAPATRVSRDLRIARVMLDENRPEQALAYLDRDARTSPPSGEAQALRIEAIIQMKRYQDAIDILNAIGMNALPGPRLSVLRARALFGQERWDYARPHLEEAIAKYPDASEAHHLLGQLYERAGDFKKASEHFRLASEPKKKN